MKLLRGEQRVRLLGAILLTVAAGGVIGFPARAAGGETYALLVGVHKYSEEKVLHPLAYAEADVAELAQVLRDGGLQPDNVVLMTQAAAADDPRFMPDRKRILKELGLLLTNRSDKDTVLIAFAGHGVHFKDDKNSYFCPADAQLDDRSTLIALTDVYAELERSKAGVKVLLVDACRNDPFQDRSRAARMDLESVTRPQLPDPPKGVVAFFSCSEKEKAYEADKLGHGVFFHYVIQGLKGEAAPDKDEVSLLDLGAYVTGKVSDYVRSEYGQVQQPELTGRSSGSAALMHIDRASLLYRQAEEAIDAQEYDKALKRLTAALKINPKYADAYAERGRVYDLKQDYDKAVADCTKALQVDPKCLGGYFWRGDAYGHKEEYDKAVADYDEAVRLAPDDAWTINNRGSWSNAKGDRDKAIADFTEAIRLDPNTATFHLNRGDVYGAKGEHEKAIDDYTEVIRLEPKNAQAYLDRGLEHLNQGDDDRCIADSSEAIRLDPKAAWAFNNRGCAQRNKGEREAALADFTEAIRLNPKEAAHYTNRGDVYAQQEEHERAIGDYSRAIDLDPKDAQTYLSRGLEYLNQGDDDKCIADSSAAIRLDPKKAWAFNNRGCARRNKGDLDAAVADFTEAIRLNPKEALHYENRAGVYESLGDQDRADADRARANRLKNP